jgi:hypothetical protein
MKDDSNILLFDSRRFSLWFRIPALAVGFFMFWMAGRMAVGLLTNIPDASPGTSVVTLIVVLFCVLMGAVWSFIWIAQKRILLDPSGGVLLIETRGYFSWRAERISLGDCQEFHVYRGRGRSGRGWRLGMRCGDGIIQWITRIPAYSIRTSWVEPFVGRLERATGKPVIHHERQP